MDVQSCPTHSDPMDCSLQVSSVHGIFQARILEWVAISFSRGSSPPRDQTRVSRIVDRRFTVWATREVRNMVICSINVSCTLYYFPPRECKHHDSKDPVGPVHLLLPWASGLVFAWSEVKVIHSCLALCDPMDYAVHGILQGQSG